MENLCAGLIEQIQAHQLSTQTTITHFVSEATVSVALLAWLKGQQLYPQFYFAYRDEPVSLACVGKVRCFSDANVAQQFVQQQDLALVGGLTFDKQAMFWLPRLLLECEGETLFIHVYWDNQQDFEAEQQACLQAVKTLENITALQTTNQTLSQSVQQAAQKADFVQWTNWVGRALQAIEQGQFSKVVLANQTTFSAEHEINAYDFLAESERKNIGCYHFLLAQQPERVFVGSSPERLYARQGRQLQTEALAGTATISENAVDNQQQADWLLNDSKNDHENRLVVQGICDNLQPYMKHLQVSEVELKKLRQVQHLRRCIQAELTPQATDANCLQAIHPTAAVSGLPQQSAVQFLQKMENFDRTWYAGTLGMMRHTQAEFCVTIRSAFIERNQLSVFAGAGIVAGSEPLLEWQEIERKASSLLSLLRIEE